MVREAFLQGAALVAGVLSCFASFEARKRRAPATSSYIPASPSGSGRTRIGCRTPCCLMFSASSASFVSSKTRRGFVLDSRIFASGIS